QTVFMQSQAPNPAVNRAALQKEVKQEQKQGKTSLSKGGIVNVGTTGGSTTSSSGGGGTTTSTGGGGTTSTTTGGGRSTPNLSKCATNSNPSQGFTSNSLRIGTIIPLTGALRPLGEQTVNVMKVSIDATLNHQTHIPGPYAKVNWGCSTRDGVFGRHVSLYEFSLQANT